jgi:hypothetical protein
MISDNFPNVFVVHYTKLEQRKKLLEQILINHGIIPTWVTESNFMNFKQEVPVRKKIIGVNERLVGMDLGINSRSIRKSRRRARIEGRILFLRSYLTRTNMLSTGSLPIKQSLESAWIELQRMHLTAIHEGLQSDKNWILVLEDDALPNDLAFEKIREIMQTTSAENVWMNLNSGAGLGRTKSENEINRHGLFEVKPAATRCAVAYLISRDLAEKFIKSAIEDGIPNWLPIDFYFQVLLRKFKAKSYWIEPELFRQGSETGEYRSGFEKFR